MQRHKHVCEQKAAFNCLQKAAACEILFGIHGMAQRGQEKAPHAESCKVLFSRKLLKSFLGYVQFCLKFLAFISLRRFRNKLKLCAFVSFA